MIDSIWPENQMSHLPISKVTDLLTQAFAIGLAATCLVFAGYKVVKLRNMENPPADLGLNFPTPKRKIITDDTVLVDSMITGSVSSQATEGSRPWRNLQPYRSEAPIQEYRLLTVIDGVAFVEILTLRGKKIVGLVPGARLPGAGTVERITMINGRWTLKAADLSLSAERQ